MIPAPAEIRTMRHGQVLELVRDHLLGEAYRIGHAQEVAIKAGLQPDWEPGRRFVHKALHAASAALLTLLADGQDAALQGKSPHRIIVAVSDALRVALVIESERRAPEASTKEGGTNDAGK